MIQFRVILKLNSAQVFIVNHVFFKIRIDDMVSLIGWYTTTETIFFVLKNPIKQFLIFNLCARQLEPMRYYVCP